MEIGYKICIVRLPTARTLEDVNPAEELTKLLEKSGRTREWLVQKTGNTAKTVKQYLNGSKTSRPFYEKVRKILMEEIANHSPDSKPPLQWDLLFETEEQFRRVDRASRRVNSESITQFCRDTLLRRANEILAEEEAVRYEAGSRRLKVAEKPASEDAGE